MEKNVQNDLQTSSGDRLLNNFNSTSVITNIAIEGVASQSSTHHSKDPSLAIDGKLMTYGDNCAKTEKEDEAWWRVDLMKSIGVIGVIITKTNHHGKTVWYLEQCHSPALNFAYIPEQFLLAWVQGSHVGPCATVT